VDLDRHKLFIDTWAMSSRSRRGGYDYTNIIDTIVWGPMSYINWKYHLSSQDDKTHHEERVISLKYETVCYMW
jgi:hypothetical protein